jgi:serine/threonine protein kinase
LIDSTVLERKILQSGKHPFIVDLKYSFQTEKKIYFIMEFIDGGELFAALKQNGRFKT